MGKSSSFPHCKGGEGNSLRNEVIGHTVSYHLRWIFSILSQAFELEGLCKLLSKFSDTNRQMLSKMFI